MTSVPYVIFFPRFKNDNYDKLPKSYPIILFILRNQNPNDDFILKIEVIVEKFEPCACWERKIIIIDSENIVEFKTKKGHYPKKILNRILLKKGTSRIVEVALLPKLKNNATRGRGGFVFQQNINILFLSVMLYYLWYY